MREARSFTISTEVLAQIEETKGIASASERVNELLTKALELERRDALEQEAAEFFSKDTEDSIRERTAFQNASKGSLSRG
jgi:hypothetical protein